MRDDADAIHAKKRAAAVFFVIRFVFDRQKCVLGQKRAGLSHRRAHEFVFEPLENRHRDRLTRFQNHVPDKAIAHHNFHGIFKQVSALDITDKVE